MCFVLNPIVALSYLSNMKKFGFFSPNSKNGAGTMKEGATDKLKDPAAVTQRSFPNKASALPQMLFSKATREDRPRNTILHPIASNRHMTMSTDADAFVSNHKFLGAIQHKAIADKQASIQHGMITANLLQMQNFDAKSASSQEQKLFSIQNQSKQASVVLQSNPATTTQNMVNAAIKPHSLGGVSHIASVSHLPSRGSIVGSTELRNSYTGPNVQLTIFYAGSVCVYDDISPEKANAIMLLAGNGSTPIRNMPVSRDKLQSPISMPSKDNGFIISQFYPSPLPSPHYVAAHANFQHGEGSCSNNELGIMRPVGSLANPSNHLESPNVVSVGSAATKMVQPVSLPHVRRASLTRFLEKRKERVMTTWPYYMSKKLP